ncbi:MAG: HAD-IB family hydrolase [Actinomycetota bacterium]|nr:HAD-IB family hydrolase [Actinomycetota bacterium]
MEAAFFDVDKTVIARSSMAAFAPAFRRQGLLHRRTLIRGAWTHLLFVRFGAGAKKVARLQRAVLALTEGWDQALVRRVVASELDSVILPVAFTDAIEAIAAHRRAGRLVYLVSAAPEEVVGPLAARLGMDGAIASQAEVDADGCYTGRMGRYVYGPAKAAAVAEFARRDGVVLADSWAFSDSVTDLPMLEAVGHPVAVNPDRALRRAAVERGWEIRRFQRVGLPQASDNPTRTASASTDANLPVLHQRSWSVPAVAAVAAATGGITAWHYLHRPAGRRPAAHRPAAHRPGGHRRGGHGPGHHRCAAYPL